MKDLKERTIRGGLARFVAQGANFLIRTGSLMILARLLTPKDFGLVGMVIAFTGVLLLFRDFGLSAAAIQREDVTREQVSTLFWINLLAGGVLALVGIALAPAFAAFYHEPRLVPVAIVLAAAFVFNGAGVQHQALLQRELRFTTMAVINTTALVAGTAIAIAGAAAGYGYWALVALAVTIPLFTTAGSWLATAWVPSMPRRRSGVRSMMRFGGTLTLSGLLAYVATNSEKVLLGRFWGAEALGLYGRAFQLINIPTDNLNSAAGEVAFAALSRLQGDPVRLKSYFLKGYALILALTLPITIACALFAPDVILALLGPQWREAVPLFRLLAPTILTFAIVNPLAWLLSSIGLVGRLLKMTLVITPLMLAGYFVGVLYGPKGVAFAYSTLMVLWIFPAIAWSVHGTALTVRDILLTVRWPLVSSIVAGALAFGARLSYEQLLSPWPRLVLESTILFAAYLGMLLFVAGQKGFYLDLLRGLKARSTAKEESLVSV
jgi:O-antigen/teichoic acid export membrane protein